MNRDDHSLSRLRMDVYMMTPFDPVENKPSFLITFMTFSGLKAGSFMRVL